MALMRKSSRMTVSAPVVSEIDELEAKMDDKALAQKIMKKYEGVPEVGIAAKIVNISDMDLVGKTAKVDLNINICYNGDKEDDKPEVQIYNLAEGTDLDEAEPKKGDEGWDWLYRIRVNGVFRQEYALHSFPFDAQTIKIMVRLKKVCKLAHVKWSPDGSACLCDPRCISDDFTLTQANVARTYLPSYKFGKLKDYDPEAIIEMTVERQPMFWAINYGVITSFVASLAGCVYAIPVDSVSDRLGVAMTLVLTIMATKYIMMDKLPSVAYFTLLDIHVCVCCMLLLVMTVEVSLPELVGQQELAKFERVFLPVTTLLWIAYHVYVALRIFVF